jgi:hypothetical protein
MPTNPIHGPASPDGHYTIDVDEPNRTVRVVTRGFWDKSAVKVFYAELDMVLKSCRARYGKIKVMSDARSLAVQSLDVNALLAESHPYKNGDKVAVVFASSLAKMAARRNQVVISDPSLEWNVFSTVEAAETWLNG